MAARHVIADAMSERRMQLTGESSPLDYDGARLVLAALERKGFTILAPQSDDGAPAPEVSPSLAAVSPAAPSSPFPRRFLLFRHRDLSDVSGTGVVADGVEFVDGAAALRWRGDHPATAAWDSVESIVAIHGHKGATELRWIDPEPHVGYWPVVEGEPE